MYFTVPGGIPTGVYHVIRSCVALAEDLKLTGLTDSEADIEDISRYRARSTGIACLVCLPELAETLGIDAKVKDCVIVTDAGDEPGQLLHWRQDRHGDWWGLVVSGTSDERICRGLPEIHLREVRRAESRVPTGRASVTRYPAPAAKRGGNREHQELLMSGINDTHVAPINEYIDQLKDETGRALPYVAPTYGGVNARLLSLFQDPGPKTRVRSGTGMLSVENPDDTAARYLDLLIRNDIAVSETQSWNAYPWYLADSGGREKSPSDHQLAEATPVLADLIELLPRLEVVLLQGTRAQKAWELLSLTHPDLTRGLTAIPSYHTGLRVLRGKPAAERERRENRLAADFARAGSILKAARVPGQPPLAKTRTPTHPHAEKAVPSREVAIPGTGEVAVSTHDEGILVYGNTGPVERYVARLTTDAPDADSTPITRKDLAAVLADGAAVASIAAQRGQFVRLSPQSLKLLKDHGVVPGTDGYNRMFVQGGGGRIAGQMQWKNVPVGPGQMMAVQMFAMQMALKTAIASVEDAVAAVQDTANQILGMIQAGWVGDVVGHHRALKRVITDFEAHGVLLSADWEARAALGPELEQVIAKLHVHLTTMVRGFDASQPISVRAANLHKAVTQKGFADSLSLLIVAQDAAYMWQILRIERVRTTEPDRIDKVIRDARTALAEHARRDEELYLRASRSLDAVREIKPLEIARRSAGRTLRSDHDRLRGYLDVFAQARRGQLAQWRTHEDPRVRDAVIAARDAVVGQALKPVHAVAHRTTAAREARAGRKSREKGR